VSDDIPLRTPSYRVSRPHGMDPATRRLMLIAAGLGGALLVLIGAWSMTGAGHPGDDLPVIAPPAGPLRVKPANPGGMRVPGTDQSIFEHAANGRNAAEGSLMAGPERPDLRALRAPGSGGAAAGSPPGPASTTTESGGLPVPPDFQPAPVAPTRTAAAPAGTALPRPAVTTPPRRLAGGGGATVQLAALPTRAAAEAEWRALRRRLPGLLGQRRLVLAQASVGGHVWWRVRTAGFAGPAQARQFCTRMRAAGAGCDVTPF